MKRLRLSKRWLLGLSWAAGLAVLTLGVLWWRLGVIPAGLAGVEQQSCVAPAQNLLARLSQLPYLALQQLLPFSCDPGRLFWYRLPATLIAALGGSLFIIAVWRWLGRRAAYYGGALFLLSAWFLHAGRLADPTVGLLLVVPAMLVIYHYFTPLPRTPAAGWLGLLVGAGLWYIPGGIWFFLAGGVFFAPQLKPYLQTLPRKQLILQAIATGLLLLPAVIGLAMYPAQWRDWLGLAAAWPGFLTVIQNIGGIPVQLFGRGPDNPAFWLGHMPVLDIFAGAMALIGLVWLFRHSGARRRAFLITISVLSWLLAGLHDGGTAGLHLMVPLAYFLSAAGIQALLRRWFGVFPRNPFARWLAYSLLGLVVATSVFLNLRAYFVAWPHAKATLETFSQQR